MKIELELTIEEAEALDKVVETFEARTAELKSAPKGFSVHTTYSALSAISQLRPEISLKVETAKAISGPLHPSEVG